MKTHLSPAPEKRFFAARPMFLRALCVVAVRMHVAALLCLPLLVSGPAVAGPPESHADTTETCRKPGKNKDCSGTPGWGNDEKETCSPELRGRCGKRRGDWYGARQPVTTAVEAQTLLQNYYAGQGYTVSAVSEKKWGFKADILDKNGAVVDRAMIDKRSGRIRSLD